MTVGLPNGVQGAGFPNYLSGDTNLAQEMSTLLAAAFNMFPGDAQNLVNEIAAALGNAGFPTTGPLMDYVNQMAAAAGGGGAVDPSALGSDPNLGQELQLLLYDAYGTCGTVGDVQNLTAEIQQALAGAGLDTSGPLMGMVQQLDALARQNILNAQQQYGASNNNNNNSNSVDPNTIADGAGLTMNWN
jgi:hypothetical protein